MKVKRRKRYRRNGTSERGAVNAISGERGIKNPSPKRYARKPGPGSAKVVLTRRIMAGLKKYPFDVGGLVTVYGIPREKATKIMSSNKSGNAIYRILSSH